MTMGTSLIASNMHAASGHSPGPRSRIRIGQIGTTHAHATKLSVYRASDDYEVVGLVESDPQRREAAKQNAVFQGLPWMTVEQLLNQHGLQAVLVETDVCDLLANAEQCVQAGKHVHIDKPAGESLDHLRRILSLADEKKLLVQMGYMYRYNPAVQRLRQMLVDGWLGEIFEVHTVMSKVVDPSSRQQLVKYPGGIMFEIGCHVLDLVIGLLGKPNSVSSFLKHSSPLQDDLLDNMLAVLDYPKATATVKSAALEVDGFARRHLVVCGSEGTFHIQPLDNPSARLTLSKAKGSWSAGTQDVSFPAYTRYLGDAADMAKIIRGEKSSDFSSQHDLIVQETLLQASGLMTKSSP
jgi:predicted dehydrogenase